MNTLMPLTRDLPRVALALAKASPHEAHISRFIKDTSEAFTFSRLSGLKALTSGSRDCAYELLLADLAVPGLAALLRSGSIPCPVILLSDPDCEPEALDLLECGHVMDYVLTSPGQLQRLPLILRASQRRFAMRRVAEAEDQMIVLQEAVYQIAEASVTAESLDALLPRIHQIVSQVMPAGNFYIALYDAEHDTLSFPYFVDEQDVLQEVTVPASRGLTEYVLRSGKSLLCARGRQQDLADSGEVVRVGTPSEIWLGVPLIVDGAAIGVMVVQHYQDGDAYGETEQRMLEFVSSQVAMVIRRKQVYDALRASEERFRGVFENANVGLARVTPDGRVLLANPALLKMLGYSSLEELQGINLDQDGYADGYSRRDFLEQMQRQGQVQGYESSWKRADGSAIYVREDSRAVRDESGMTLYFESVVEDITDRRRAESALQEKVLALQSLAEIDREILAAENVQSILELVCDRIARLLHAPKSAILTREGGSSEFTLAHFGFELQDILREELALAVERGVFDRSTSLAIPNLMDGGRSLTRLMAAEDLRALVLEPFSTTSGLRGALAVFDTRSRQWTPDETQLVRLLAGQAALALEKIRLLTDARRRASEFAGLYQVAGELMGRRDINSLLTLIVSKASGFQKVSNAFIYLYDEKKQKLELSVVSNNLLYLGAVLSLGEGMAGRVAQSKNPMILDDYSAWEGRAPVFEGQAVRAVLEVPMLFGGDLIGVLGVESLDPSRRFDEDDLRSLSLLAEQAAGALHNARLFSHIQDRNRELDRISRASSTLLAGVSSDAASLCRSIAELLVSEFNYSNCSIWLIGDDDHSLTRGAISGPFSQDARSTLLTTRGPGIVPHCARSGVSINLGDVSLSNDYVPGWEQTRSELAVPLRSDDRVLGVVDLQSSELNAYSADDERLIELIANRASLLLEHVRLYKQTEHRLRQLTILSNIDAAIASSLDLQVTLNILVSQISMHLQADAVDVLLYNPHLQVLQYATGRGFRGTNVRTVNLLLGEDQAGQAALDRSVVSIANLGSDQVTLAHPERLAGEDFVSMYAVPLIAKGEVKGVLELFFRHALDPGADWVSFLEILARQAAVAVEDASLFNDMQRSLTELAVAYDASIEAWARITQTRINEPEDLVEKLASLTLELCRRLSFPETCMSDIYRGVLLHDIGKVSIPDIILQKNGPLTDDEWQVVRGHPSYAHELLQPIAHLRPAMNIPYCQHERWDGTGYPRGLRGEEIPREARVFAVVNTWTMLQQSRPYERCWDRQQATDYIREQSGSQFDPLIVDEFIQLLAEMDFR